MKGKTTNLPKTNHFINRNTYICEPCTSHLTELPVSGYYIWLSKNSRMIPNLTVALIVILFAVFYHTQMLFAAPFDATWGSRLTEGAMALENRRGPNPINSLVPINPEIGSPSGRLESDGGSATGNYHLDIPLISLPGRGIDLIVTAKYNSQIWSKVNEPESPMFEYNLDGDWPVPGLNIGFGKLVFPNNGLFIHPDGSRQALSEPKPEVINGSRTGRLIAKFMDGSEGVVVGKYHGQANIPQPYIVYVCLKNGTKMEMLTVSSPNINDSYTFYPVKIIDSNGNFIKIDYRTDSSGNLAPPNIDYITDTVGRIVQFHYDNNSGLPIAITGPDQHSGSRVYARFYYHKINFSIRMPYVGLPGSIHLELNFQVLDAIYFPGNQTGYVFTDYTPYGIPKTVSVNRNMSTSSDSLSIQDHGMMTRRAHFDYPDNDHDFIYRNKTPKYSNRIDTWVDLVNEVFRKATTHYDTNRRYEVMVTAPDGTSTLQRTNGDRNSWNYGLADWTLTKAKDGQRLEKTSFIWELGADNIPRQKEVQVHNYETNAIKRVEFRYGKNNRQITDEIHYDYVGANNINQAKVLKHKVSRYLDMPEYSARYFNLVSETSIFDGTHTANPAYAAWQQQISQLQRDIDQARGNVESAQQAIDRAQAACDKEVEKEPEPTIVTYQGHEITNPEWTKWRRRMDSLLVSLNQAKANALSAQQVMNNAQSAYDSAIQLQPPQTIEKEIERTSFQYDTSNLIAASASQTGYSPIVDPSTPRGLVSRVTRWLAPDSQSITESGGNLRGIHTDFIHDETGNLRIVQESPTSQLSYNYDRRTNYSLPSSIAYGATDLRSPVRNTTEIMYDLGLGLPVRVTDENGISSEISYKPGAPGWRTNSVTMSTGMKTTLEYNDSFLSITSKVADAEGRIYYDQTSRYDGLGLLCETRRQRRTDDGHDIIEYRYDNMGRKIRQSLPWRTTENRSIQWIDSTYDTAGRLATVTSPNGTVSWFYNEPTMPHGVPFGTIGPTIRVERPLERESWTMSNSLGQMRYVVKSDPSTGKISDSGSQLAEHLYDARGLLTRSYYGSQMRIFQHDSLGRLTGVTIPERAKRLDIQGNYSIGEGLYSDIYQYDDQSNLVTHIDPRGVRAIFNYANDPLKRLQSVSYDLRTIDGAFGIWPTARTIFDYVRTGDRRRPRSITTEGILQKSFTYNAQGLPETITTKFDAAPNSPLEMSMQYDSMGRPTVFRYPERYENGNKRGVNQLEYLYSKDGELVRINLDGGNLIDNVLYTTFGIKHLDLFNQGVHLSENYDYDPQSGRLNKQSLTNNSNPQQELLELSYDYSTTQVCCGTGQITHQDSLLGNPVRKSHTYDAWGRLTSSILKAGIISDATRQNYGYDIYGNRITVKAQRWQPVNADWIDLPDASADGISVPVVNSSNQIKTAGYLYDGAGNLARGPGPDGRMQSYIYDAAGRLVCVEDDNHNLIEAYQYGEDRRRVGVSTDRRIWRLSLWNGPTEMARYDLQAGALNWVDMPIYFGSRLLAELQHTQNGATLKMFHPDHRDSVLTTEVIAGALQSKRQTALAFGADNTPTDQIDGDRRFTSYRRSKRTGLDYAINRYYDSKLGRFIQPDPLGMGSFKLDDPQSLNAYAYVGNDPVNQVDPLGLLPPDCKEGEEKQEGGETYICTDGKWVLKYQTTIREPRDGIKYMSRKEVELFMRSLFVGIKELETAMADKMAGGGGAKIPKQKCTDRKVATIEFLEKRNQILLSTTREALPALVEAAKNPIELSLMPAGSAFWDAANETGLWEGGGRLTKFIESRDATKMATEEVMESFYAPNVGGPFSTVTRYYNAIAPFMSLNTKINAAHEAMQKTMICD